MIHCIHFFFLYSVDSLRQIVVTVTAYEWLASATGTVQYNVVQVAEQCDTIKKTIKKTINMLGCIPEQGINYVTIDCGYIENSAEV